MLLSIWEMYESASIEVTRERNIESVLFRKKGWTTVPTRNVFVSVFTHISKEIIKNVSNSTGFVNSFSTLLKKSTTTLGLQNMFRSIIDRRRLRVVHDGVEFHLKLQCELTLLHCR